ncbi:hypothetical protein F4780DRAFT_483115 [Xylariomycetidae sp. FL0641]|nr:hypothetical protein F4780DRAFT_483115 [Xylariomycetidae sp. FL0641]
MTSPVNQQAANTATNTPAAAPAPSYASAAGAAKKPATTPVVATGSNAPVVAAGSSAPNAHHAKSSSVSPMNGRPNIMPAVPTPATGAPAVAHGTSNLNGVPDHARKSSVTMNPNGPSSYSTNGGSLAPNSAKSAIQFGFQESPAVSHSSPQLHGAAPIPIPGNGNDRVRSPQNSPSPIPQPSATGGRPPSGTAQQGGSMTFGSFGDADRTHMRAPSASQDPLHGAQHSPHLRRTSNASDASNQAGPQHGGMGRGGYPGRNRGGYNNQFNPNMGYPPSNFNRGPQGGQRGGMPPSFGGNGRPHSFGTPPPQNRSPAMPAAMPQQPPNMGPNMGPPPYYYGPPQMGPTQMPQVMLPPFQQTHDRTAQGPRKKGFRRDSEKFPNHRNRTDFTRNGVEMGQKARRLSRRSDLRSVDDDTRSGSQLSSDLSSASGLPHIPLPHPYPIAPYSHEFGRMDLSPKSGNFDRVLTNVKQNFYPPYDPSMRGPSMPMQPGYPVYPMMHGQGQSPGPNFQQPYVPGPYNAPGGQPMSRNSSQVSADPRPASSTGQHQAPVAQGTPQSQPAQMKPAVVSGSHFTRPAKKSSAITIKNLAGETLDLKNLKAPASPAASSQPSKTPPIVSSTPTPPPKVPTPKTATPSHIRTDSASNAKTAEEVRNEFKAKMQLAAAGGDSGKEDDSAKASPEKATPAAPAAGDSKEKAKEVESTPVTDNTKAKEEPKEKAEPPAKPSEAEAVKADNTKTEAPKPDDTKTEAPKPEEPAKPEPAKTEAPKSEAPKAAEKPSEDDEIERMIQEMEEAEAKREKEAADYQAKKDAEAAAKKAEAEKNKPSAEESDRLLKEQEREMERIEDEKMKKREAEEKKRLEGSNEKASEAKPETTTTSETTSKLANLSLNDKPSAPAKASPGAGGRGPKPAALNLAPLNTKSVEPPQPSAALQSLKTARLLDVIKTDIYPPGISSPNPALNAAVAKKGTSFKYDPGFLLQFKGVFTEQPSLDFHQQVKTLIGDGESGRSASVRTPATGRQGSRPGSGFPGPIGSFNVAPTGRTLPPGTTSQQRFEMADKRVPSMANFTRPGGAFPGGNSMSRTPSSGMGSMPHSPRERSKRQPSKQNTFNAKAEAQAAKTMPLTANMKIEALPTSSTGWKPSSVGKSNLAANTQSAHMDPAMVQRKVKAALNKMTPENFERISEQILQIAAQSKDETDGRTLRQVIQLTFEKATDEAHWASMYAKFCKRMLETMSPEIRDESIKDKTGQVVSGGALFRKYLLNRCQEEFERGWKVDLPKESEDKKPGEAVMLSDEYYVAAAAKRRGLGLVQFIGELYKLGMLTERIMHECVRKLVDYSGVPDEAEVESLSKLLRTIGANLDATDKGKIMMDAYFQRIQGMIDMPELPSRLQFMLMDVMDLRRARWVSKEANKGPKTLEEVRAEAEAAAAAKAAEAARGNQRGGGGRAPMGRGDARNFSSGFHPQAAPNQVGMDDLRRLKGGSTRTSSSGLTLGPMSMLGSRSNSGRRLGPGGSLSRGAEESGASSRTGTPPVRDSQSSTNAFSLLANMESDHPGSPPSTKVSPALAKATPEAAATAEKQGN